MIDRYNRTIEYLRISVTDLCNLRCVYCRPAEGVELLPHDEILRFEEIHAIALAAAECGVTKFRITGGEPLVKRGILSLVEKLASVPGVDDLAMTTNGVLLARWATGLRQAGLRRINVSLDTLQAERFAAITRGGQLQDVLDGIQAAADAGFRPVKINVVVMRGMNDDEVGDFARLTLSDDVEVRFIEFMALGKRSFAEDGKLVRTAEIRERLAALGPLEPAPASPGGGPAERFRLPNARGHIAFISPVSQPFCRDCNRIRLTADGKLRSCLLAGGEVDVKRILRSGGTHADLLDAIRRVVALKPLRHDGCGHIAMHRIGG